MGNLSQSYEVAPAIQHHTVVCHATQLQVPQFTYSRRIEG